jgi:hypothetical protein
LVGDKGYSYPPVRRLLRQRGIATRYDKRAGNYRAAVVLASLLWWLND